MEINVEMDKKILNKDITKSVERNIALRVLIAGIIVFVFALGSFITVKYLNSGQADGMPLAQVKQDGEWMLIRADYYMNVDPNITGYDFVENQENGGYDLVLHYVKLD